MSYEITRRYGDLSPQERADYEWLTALLPVLHQEKVERQRICRSSRRYSQAERDRALDEKHALTDDMDAIKDLRAALLGADVRASRPRRVDAALPAGTYVALGPRRAEVVDGAELARPWLADALLHLRTVGLVRHLDDDRLEPALWWSLRRIGPLEVLALALDLRP